MKDKRCLIIGATSDIAKELISLFAQDGYNLDLVARRTDELERIKSDLEIRFGINVQKYYLDIEDSSTIVKFLENYQYKPEIVIFAIGYLGNQKLAEVDSNEARTIIDVNYTNQIPILNFFANLFEKENAGTIIGISSIAGERGRKTNYIYGSAKAALTQYLSGLRQRLSNTQVNIITIKPGFIKTKMTSHLSVPKIFEGDAQNVARNIYKAYTKRKTNLITPPIYHFLNLVIKLLPEGIFKRLNI